MKELTKTAYIIIVVFTVITVMVLSGAYGLFPLVLASCVLYGYQSLYTQYKAADSLKELPWTFWVSCTWVLVVVVWIVGYTIYLLTD